MLLHARRCHAISSFSLRSAVWSSEPPHRRSKILGSWSLSALVPSQRRLPVCWWSTCDLGFQYSSHLRLSTRFHALPKYPPSQEWEESHLSSKYWLLASQAANSYWFCGACDSQKVEMAFTTWQQQLSLCERYPLYWWSIFGESFRVGASQVASR